MATYWKSQPKKYCKFCNCWITDNKASVDFHEKGKNHQENVKRKIDEVKKKSSEQAKIKEEEEDDLRKMEKAAMEAFKKDLKDNPELAAKYGIKIKTDAEKKAEAEEKRKAEETKRKEEEAKMLKLATCKWFEAKSPEGYSYYWNVETNQSIWVAPEQYVSIEEQKDQEEKEKAQQELLEQKKNQQPEPVEDIPEPVTVGPLPRVPQSAYGSWKTIEELEEEEYPADFLGLPTEPPPPLPEEPEAIPLPPSEPLPVPEIPLPPPPGKDPSPPPLKEEDKPREKPSKFKEKRVSSLGKDTNVTFKKRKIAAGARNVRQRDDD